MAARYHATKCANHGSKGKSRPATHAALVRKTEQTLSANGIPRARINAAWHDIKITSTSMNVNTVHAITAHACSAEKLAKNIGIVNRDNRDPKLQPTARAPHHSPAQPKTDPS